MGDRVSIQFKNGSRLSPILFSHWGGMDLVEEAHNYTNNLIEEAEKNGSSCPLYRREIETVIVDFIRHITQGLDRVEGDLYLVCSEGEGDNSDNGHHIIDLNKKNVFNNQRMVSSWKMGKGGRITMSKTKEIVINKCYGGFSLSHQAMELYAKKKGFKLYPFIEKRYKNGSFIPNKFRMLNTEDIKKLQVWDCIYYSTEPLIDEEYKEDCYFGKKDIARDDLILIQVVKQLGNEANTKYSKLKVIKIPSDMKYTIEENDGMEWVTEEHRTFD